MFFDSEKRRIKKHEFRPERRKTTFHTKNIEYRTLNIEYRSKKEEHVQGL
jgi:hypothetical protein